MTAAGAESTSPRDELELGQFIPLHYHFNMLGDVPRMDAFETALDVVVPDGGTVVELGGGTGVLSFFAARRAARVWCVERNPELAQAARTLLRANGAEAVEVVERDARDFVPPEPVDVVVCEMLHVGLLREKQVEVVNAFARNYLERHGPPLPRFVPDATVQAVQPLQQDFDFHGYRAPTPLFQDPHAVQPRTVELGAPVVYQSFLYESSPLPERVDWQGTLAIETAGELNALRVVTKNLLAIVPRERRSVDWLMSYLVVPLATPLRVEPGDRVRAALSYRAGDPIDALAPELTPA